MIANFVHRYLDPVDSLGELLFGLIMALTLTLGARQEWWRAYGGFNTTLSTAVNSTIQQGVRRFNGFSPKLDRKSVV